MFKLFGSKKKKENIADLLEKFATYQKLIDQISKAQSLEKLNRIDEAQQLLRDAERMVIKHINQNPREKNAHMMLALFYIETDDQDQAESIIERLLTLDKIQLSNEERTILSSNLQKIQRQRPLDQRTIDSPKNFTQIYCCASCGRLHNFVSMPCPHCDWSPQTIEEMALSMGLASPGFKVPELLILAREMDKGRSLKDIIPNLQNIEDDLLLDPVNKQCVDKTLSLLRQNEHKNHRNISMIRECTHCGNRILLSDAEECTKCGALVNWPETIRLLACMDNLLWLLEQRVEVASSDAFADFVCVLVAMTNNLLRKQEIPSLRDRQYSLKLLTDMSSVCDLNNGAVIDTKNLKDLKIYLIKENMLEDSQDFGIFLFQELTFFVAKMADGIRH